MKILHKIMQSFRRKQPSCPGLPPPVPRRATAPDTGKKASDPTTPSREPLRLTIGLDFGTSTAKCIVHTIMGREQAENRFLCPISGKDLFSTQAWQFEDRVHLSNRPDGPAQPLDSPKIAMRNLLLDKPGARFDPRDPSPDPKALCWALLSHCTQEIR